MQKILITSIVTASSWVNLAQAAPAQYELDPEHTTVFFTVHHIGFADTLGIFGDVSGTFVYDMETQTLSDVSVTLKSDSVDTFNVARNNHVKNKDFLDAGQFPEITFTAAGGTPTSDTAGTVTGDLTILGQTHPVTLSVTLNKAAQYPFGHKRFVLGLSMETMVQRSQYGMEYAVANGLVGDEIAVRIETEAMRME